MNKILYFCVLSLLHLSFESKAMEESRILSPIFPSSNHPIEQKPEAPTAKRQRPFMRQNAFSGQAALERIETASRAAASVGAYFKEKHGGEIPSLEGENTRGLTFYIAETSSSLSQSLESISEAMQGKIFTDDLSFLTAPKFKEPVEPHRPHRKPEGIPPKAVSPPQPVKQQRTFDEKTPPPKKRKISKEPKPDQNPRKKPQGQRPTS